MQDNQLSKEEISQLTDADWKARLTADEYHVMREKAQSAHLLAFITTSMIKVSTAVKAAVPACLSRTISLTPVAAGQASIRVSIIALSMSTKTIHLACAVPK